MRERYTKAEACEVLGCDMKTLTRWMKLEHIEPQPDKYDLRGKYLTHAQVEQIAAAHHRELRDPGQQPAPSADDTLLARIAAMEREIATLRASRRSTPSQMPKPPIDAPKDSPAPRRQRGTGRGFAWRSKGNFSQRQAGGIAEQHGANNWRSAIDWGWEETDLVDKASILRRAKAYLDGHPRAGKWRTCGLADCECPLI